MATYDVRKRGERPSVPSLPRTGRWEDRATRITDDRKNETARTPGHGARAVRFLRFSREERGIRRTEQVMTKFCRGLLDWLRIEHER